MRQTRASTEFEGGRTSDEAARFRMGAPARRSTTETSDAATRSQRQAGVAAAHDLEGLQVVHRHLFKDVAEWAGHLRTTEIGNGARVRTASAEGGVDRAAEDPVHQGARSKPPAP